MLTIDQVSCIRQERVLFKDLGFTIGDCCLVVIKGPNGSGKSSLLRIIAQLLEPDAGQVMYANESLDGQHRQEFCQMIHYIGHKSALKLNQTVRQNLQFWASLHGCQDTLFAPAVHFFKLEPLLDIPLYQLSAGWQKRVCLARLLIRQSEIWLLDEPYTFLDATGKRLLDGLIQARLDQGGSVVVATNEELSLDGQHIIDIRDYQEAEA